MASAYNPALVEAGWYDWWEAQDYFKPDIRGKKQFNMVLPPPNVTGTLHLGHALTATIQDVLVRWKRMQGESVLWVPGTDHAGIATQVVVEKTLKQESNATKHDIGREEFIKRVWSWKQSKEQHIIQQLRSIGASVDWSRHVFTMDKAQSEAVNTAFIHLFKTDLIYRANSMVNWSCHLQSSISDIEVDLIEINEPTQLCLPGYDKPVTFGQMTDIAYKVHNEDMEIIVSTTRPETMLGDVAVAVHPADHRFTHLHNKRVWHPFRGCSIPIITDEFVDPSLGSGAVKITPAHDPKDLQVAAKHGLEVSSVIDERGMMQNVGSLNQVNGLQRYRAREVLLAQLAVMSLLRGTRPHATTIPVCSRSGDVVEHIMKPQWFVKCTVLAERALDAVRSGKLVIQPQNFDQVWVSWMEGIRDWNISRQLWWGHQVPAFECASKDRTVWVAALDATQARREAEQQLGQQVVSIFQDPDVLDTWFSSALFPFSSLGWPSSTSDMERYYPLNLMATGHDILLFWVARMVMLGTELTGQLPFDQVLLHGVVCDSRGRKMSKSVGNVISPEDVIGGVTREQLEQRVQDAHKNGSLAKAELERSLEGQRREFPQGITACGSDALRFTLMSAHVQDMFINFDITLCHTNKLFFNKVWQAFKYLGMSLEQNPTADVDVRLARVSTQHLNLLDRWILSRLSAAVARVDEAFSTRHFHSATFALKAFLYWEFCDVYLEATKPVVRHGSPSAARAEATLCVLFNCLEASLRLLAPITPFLSEELYQRLPRLKGFHPAESVMVSPYPSPALWDEHRDVALEKQVAGILDVIASIRRFRVLYKFPVNKARVVVTGIEEDVRPFYKEQSEILARLGSVAEVCLEDDFTETERVTKDMISDTCTIYFHLQRDKKDLYFDLKPYLKKEDKLRYNLGKLVQLMGADGYQTRAPLEIQKNDWSKRTSLEVQLKKIQDIKESLRIVK